MSHILNHEYKRPIFATLEDKLADTWVHLGAFKLIIAIKAHIPGSNMGVSINSSTNVAAINLEGRGIILTGKITGTRPKAEMTSCLTKDIIICEKKLLVCQPMG